MMWNIQQTMQDDAIRTTRIHPAFIPVTGLKCSCGKISRLRSKRFRLFRSKKKKRGTGVSVLTAREMKREPFFPTPPRSFTCAIFRVVFDSCFSFFTPKPHRNACYAGYKISSPLTEISVGKTEISGTEPARHEHIENLKQRI